MLWLKYLVLLTSTLASRSSLTTTPSFEEIAEGYTRRTAGGVHLPIVRTEANELRRRSGLTSAIGLGDFEDVQYSVLVSIGGTSAPLALDTGSSDLWVISDKCLEGCTPGQAAYPQASFQYSGADAELLYGDSSTRTFASGMIGKDAVRLAGLSLPDQYFAAVNRTNNTLGTIGLSGIFGLGFPAGSDVWGELWNQSRASNTTTRRDVPSDDVPILPSNNKYRSRTSPSFDFRWIKFPSRSDFFDTLPAGKQRRQTGNANMAPLLASWSVFGPLLSRFVTTSQLILPMFSITLQRDSIQIGGNVGMLSVGELPSGTSNDSLTWVPIRAYTVDEGGLPAPTDAPNEVYPLNWEVPLDDVYLDGVKLPRSTLSPSISLSAIVDTGTSIVLGPADVVQQIQTTLGSNGSFPCSEPHNISFSIGGKLFAVDPRDFITPVFDNDDVTCTSLLDATDPPSNSDGYEFSWILGDPFLKGVLATFYYGNLTYPSQDPPRMGFLSTVTADAASQLASAIAAVPPGGNFPFTSEVAPSGTPKVAVPKAAATGSTFKGSKSGKLHHAAL